MLTNCLPTTTVETTLKSVLTVSLNLQQIFLRSLERVDAYCFLKVLDMLVLNLATRLLVKNRKKMSPQKLQKEIAYLTILEQRLQPIGVHHWVGKNIPNIIDVLVNLFSLPHPIELIDIINSSINFLDLYQEGCNLVCFTVPPAVDFLRSDAP